MRATHWLAVRVVAVLFLAVAPAAAQLNRATIAGTVTDPTTAQSRSERHDHR
jgi:hypothetical protein